MPEIELSPEIAAIVDYARRKYAEERWPLSPAMRPLREALAKLDPQPAVPVTRYPAPIQGERSHYLRRQKPPAR
jgi:hypothetical protein